jgi:hypothetical protein
MGEVTIGRAAPKAGVFGQTAAVQGEGSLFYQNTILPETNLTVAYDSAQSLNSATGVPGMFTLDPLNRVYPVFGDSSQQGYAAPANSKLFARVDHLRSYLMFGDIRDEISGDPQNAVAEFARNITGVKAHVEKDSNTFISVMAARPNTAFGRDVVPGSSLGLIQLTHGNLLAGSETVVIETRDRRNPEIILSQQPLVRNVDYNINPFSGTVMLMRTISQFDKSFNLNQIVFTYEYQAATLSSGLYSVRTGFAMANLSTRIQSSFLNDNSSGTGSYFLGSLQVDQKLANGGHLTAVLPVSYGNGVSGNSLPVSGGASGIGTAWRAQLEQPFGLWQGKAGLNFSKTSDSFSAPFAQTVVPGPEIINSYVDTNPLSALHLRLMYTSERNSASNVNNGRQREALKWTQSLRETLDVTLGLDHRDYTNHLAGQDIKSTMVEAGLDWRITSKLQAPLSAKKT